MNWYLTIGVVYFIFWLFYIYRNKEERELSLAYIKELALSGWIVFILSLMMSFAILVALWPIHVALWVFGMYYLKWALKDPEFFIKKEIK